MTRAAILSLAALIIGGCRDQGPPRASGAVRVFAPTRGLDPDPDGYALIVDGATIQSVATGGMAILPELSPGPHTLSLGGVAANCTSEVGNATTVDVVVDDTADLTLAVACTSTFASVSVGYLFACGITVGSATYCWGINHHGQLGGGDPTGPEVCAVYNGQFDQHYPCSTTPAMVVGGLQFAAVSSGSSHACGITTNGAAYCWGDNNDGELGDGTTSSRASPAAVQGGLRFVSVSAGTYHTCGLTTGGAAYCWGVNRDGELGDSTTTSRSTPVPVVGGLTFALISAGTGHTCAVTPSDIAYCWGWNINGELGDSGTTSRTSPVAVAGGLSFARISAGGRHTCGLTTTSVVYCWGYNATGQIGDGTTSDRASPVVVLNGSNVSLVNAGGGETCSIAAGAAFCWGWNYWGQLGNGTTGDASTPVPVSGGLSFAHVGVAAGGAHACGLTTAGLVYCWGDGAYGELGDGQAGSGHLSPVPLKVAGQP